MMAFLLKRVLGGALVMLVVGFVSFGLFQYVGDPVASLLGQDATEQQRIQLRGELGLDRPAPVQFARFVANAARGEFGLSLSQGRKVSALILERLPATVELACTAALVSVLVGIPMGLYAALRRRQAGSQGVMLLSLLGMSMPTFLLGILLILVFSVALKWLPSFGRGEVVALGWWRTGFLTASGWMHLVLPVLTLAAFQVALLKRLVRAEMLEVLRADHIKFARARGLGPLRVHFSHALKNTLVPVLTIMGLQLGGLIAFAIITESVFQWPGLGLLFIQAIAASDVPVMAAYLCLVALVFVTLNLVVDLLHLALDPRLRVSAAAGG